MLKKIFQSGLLGLTLSFFGCLDNDPNDDTNEKFKPGLYYGTGDYRGIEIHEYTYFKSTGDFEFYYFHKLNDYDSIVCWAKTKGKYLESGDSIKFKNHSTSEREILALKDVNNLWGEWKIGAETAVPKKVYFKDYGHDYFVRTKTGGNSNGDTWSLEFKNSWIGNESNPLPHSPD